MSREVITSYIAHLKREHIHLIHSFLKTVSPFFKPRLGKHLDMSQYLRFLSVRDTGKE
jgi:hypothetical protein